MRLFTAFVFFLFVSVCDAQVMFQKTYGKDSTDWGVGLIKTNDGGYLMTGKTIDYDRGKVYILLIRTDADGDTLWTKTIGDTTGDCSVSSLQKTTDGGFILLGFVMNSITGNGGICLLKADANANALWAKTYSGVTAIEGLSVQQTNDSGYIIAGYGSYNTYACISLIRTDNLGDTIWTRAYADSTGNNLYGFNILPNADGSFIVTAGGTGSETVLLKVDSSGNLVLAKHYLALSASSIQHTNDGNYVLAGGMVRTGFTDNDIAMVKIDTSGNLIWIRNYGTTTDESGSTVLQTIDGGYIINVSNYVSGVSDAILTKTDEFGNLLWAKAFGDTNTDYAAIVLQSVDGGFILFGSSNSFGNGAMDFYLIRTDSGGMSGCHEWIPSFSMGTPSVTVSSGGVIAINPQTNVNTVSLPVSTPSNQVTTLCYTVGIEEINAGENSISLFPNPATNEFTIKNAELKIKVVEIYDVLGEKVFGKDVTAGYTDVLTINTAEFNSGIYFVSIKTAEGIVVKKLVVQR